MSQIKAVFGIAKVSKKNAFEQNLRLKVAYCHSFTRQNQVGSQAHNQTTMTFECLKPEQGLYLAPPF